MASLVSKHLKQSKKLFKRGDHDQQELKLAKRNSKWKFRLLKQPIKLLLSTWTTTFTPNYVSCISLHRQLLQAGSNMFTLTLPSLIYLIDITIKMKETEYEYTFILLII